MSGDHNQSDSGWRKRQIALDKKAENARELGLDYEPDKTIMDMARESWIDVYGLGHDRISFVKALEAFAALVREDEAEKHKWEIHSCGPTCMKVGCVAMREAVIAEREACAKEFDRRAVQAGGTLSSGWYEPDEPAQIIRARGNT